MKKKLRSWWPINHPSEKYLNQLISETDVTRERVSNYSLEKKANLLKHARAIIKKSSKKV